MLKRIIHFSALFSGRSIFMWPGLAIARAGRRILHKKSVSSALKLFIGLMFVCHSGFGWGQMSLTNVSPTNTISFSNSMQTSVGTNPSTAFTGAGFQPNPVTAGRLNSNAWAFTGFSDGSLAFGGTQTTAATDYTRGSTAVAITTGGIYAFIGAPQSVANPCLMIQPGSSDWAPGTMTLRIRNDGTSNITSLDINYNIYIRNDQDRSNSFNFSYSSDDVTYTPVAALNYTSIAPLDALGWVLVGTAPSRSTTISSLSIAPGAYFYIRWSGADVGGSGSRDEFGLDDISVTATYSGGTPNIVLSSPNPAVPAANIAQWATKQPIYYFTTAVTVANTTLNSVSFITTNSAATDIAKYQLWYNTSNNFATATQIGSDITATLGTGTHTFGSLTQTINNGTTGYFWITVDVAGGAVVGNTLSVSTAITTANLIFSSGTKSGTAYVGGVQTIIAAVVPNIVLASPNPAVAAANISQGAAKQQIYYFTTAVTLANTTLNSVSFITTNTAATDITKYQLWYSTSNSLSTATQIGSDITAALGTGTHTFAGLTQTINNGSTGYFWITVDVASGAVIGNTLSVSTAITTANLIFNIGNKSGTAYTGGIQTIIASSIAILNYGDLAILGVAAQNAPGGGAGTTCDEISFVCFKDITNGTVIQITDCGYEHTSAGFWGTTEGGAILQRTGGTIPAGTVITFRDKQVIGDIVFISPDNQWNVTGGFANGEGNVDLNASGDQMFFANGLSVYTNGGLNLGDYPGGSGQILYAFTTNGVWAADGSTNNSNLYPGMSCFNTQLSLGVSNFMKYTGVLTAASQRDWIDRINNSTNWSTYADYATYSGASPNLLGLSIPIIVGGFSNGVWMGTLNTDWFLCDNWENMRVPDTATNVTINNALGSQPTINNTALARCSDIIIGVGKTLTVNNNGNFFDIYGTLTNNGTFTHTAGTVRLVGGKHKSIAGSNPINFYNLILNKNTNSLTITLNRSIQIQNTLTMTRGLILTGVNTLEIGYNTSNRGSLTMGTGIVVGNVKRWFTNAANSGVASGGFPIGVATNSRTAMIEYTGAPTTGGSLTAVFSTTLPGDYYQGLPLWDGGQQIDNLANEGFWVITSADGLSGGTYTCSLTGTGFLTAADPSKVRILKRPTAGGNWTLNGSHDPTGIWPTVKRTGMSGFSQFAMGGLYTDGNPLPVDLLSFSAKYKDKVVSLNWSTASETNNDYFMVERSADAKLFNPLFSVKGAGNSNQILSYSAVDVYPLKGINYYRLKQTDYDSKVSYSKVVSVNITENNCDFNMTSVYVQNNVLKIQLNCIDSDLTIDITDINGRVVLTQQINASETDQFLSLVLPDLNKGIYLLRATTDKSVVVKKFYL